MWSVRAVDWWWATMLVVVGCSSHLCRDPAGCLQFIHPSPGAVLILEQGNLPLRLQMSSFPPGCRVRLSSGAKHIGDIRCAETIETLLRGVTDGNHELSASAGGVVAHTSFTVHSASRAVLAPSQKVWPLPCPVHNSRGLRSGDPRPVVVSIPKSLRSLAESAAATCAVRYLLSSEESCGVEVDLSVVDCAGPRPGTKKTDMTARALYCAHPVLSGKAIQDVKQMNSFDITFTSSPSTALSWVPLLQSRHMQLSDSEDLCALVTHAMNVLPHNFETQVHPPRLAMTFPSGRHTLQELTNQVQLLASKPPADHTCGKHHEASGAGHFGAVTPQQARGLIVPGDFECNGKVCAYSVHDAVKTHTAVHPCAWLNGRRLDIFAKVLFAEGLLRGTLSLWPVRVYLAHLRGFNDLKERDGKNTKDGADDFITSFVSTLKSVCSQGLLANESLVPVHTSNGLLNGAHRVAAAYACGRLVDTVTLKGPAPWRSDWRFFQPRVPIKFTDAMALQMIKARGDLRLTILFPASRDSWNRMEQALSGYGEVEYSKDVELKDNSLAPALLVHQIYMGEPWTGSESNDFLGIRSATRARFVPGSGSMIRVLVLRMESLQLMVQAKSSARKQALGLSYPNAAIHSTDTPEETLRIAQSLLNQNSIDFLNHARRFPPNLREQTGHLRKWMHETGIAPGELVFDSSAVLAALGLRPSNDFDVVIRGVGPTPWIEVGASRVNCHNEYYSAQQIDDIVDNPEMHFHFDGIKYTTIDVTRQMKIRRVTTEHAYAKDIIDIDVVIDEFTTPRRADTQGEPCSTLYQHRPHAHNPRSPAPPLPSTPSGDLDPISACHPPQHLFSALEFDGVPEYTPSDRGLLVTADFVARLTASGFGVQEGDILVELNGVIVNHLWSYVYSSIVQLVTGVRSRVGVMCIPPKPLSTGETLLNSSCISVAECSSKANAVLLKSGSARSMSFQRAGTPKQRKVVDCFTFFNELALLQLRLNELTDMVDTFVLVEATHTFTGQPKRLYFNESKHQFEGFLDRIVHVIFQNPPTGENLSDAEVWERESAQRNAIGLGVQKLGAALEPDDWLLISDVDEIPDPSRLNELWTKDHHLHAFEQDLFFGNIRCRLATKWYHSKILPVREFTDNFRGSAQAVREECISDGKLCNTIKRGGYNYDTHYTALLCMGQPSIC